MAWIESHETLRDHPKTKRAARLLGVSIPTMIGHLHLLWWWTTEYAEDGDLSRYDAADIADATGWDGEPERFIEALLSCGPGGATDFLERKGGRLVVHDWAQYAGRLIAAREDGRKGNHERWHVQRGMSDPNCHYCHPEVGGDIGGDSPPESHGESTNQTKPNLPDETETRARATTPPAPPIPPIAVPDERADDTPARRILAEAYCRLTGRLLTQVTQRDLNHMAEALERTDGDPKPIIRTMESVADARLLSHEKGRIGSFLYFLRAFQNGAAPQVAAARASPEPLAKTGGRKYDDLIRG